MPRSGARILLVEDEPAWAQILTQALAAGGHGVRAVHSAAAARQAVQTDPPDLVVLDLTLPDEDGLVLCVDLKATLAVPVLICSLTRRRHDAVLGLRLGADDFVARPCDLDELLERVGVLLRTRAPAPPGGAAAVAAGRPSRAGPAAGPRRLVLDRTERRVCLGAASTRLTSAEYRLLAALAERPGETVARQALARTVFGQPEVRRTLDTLVWRLRGKLAALGPGAPRVVSARGLGYALLGGIR